MSLLNVSKRHIHFSKIQKRILSKHFQNKFNDSFLRRVSQHLLEINLSLEAIVAVIARVVVGFPIT
jgi:hypothetical protein